jgi:hypothetical protein
MGVRRYATECWTAVMTRALTVVAPGHLLPSYCGESCLAQKRSHNSTSDNRTAQTIWPRSSRQIALTHALTHPSNSVGSKTHNYVLTTFRVIAATAACALAFGPHASLGQGNPHEAGRQNYQMVQMDRAKLAGWEAAWKRNIFAETGNHYCDKEKGEEIGWLISPLLKGFYYGYMATGDPKWVRMLVDCTDAWIKRAVTEPDGYPGWPKVGAAGTPVDDLDDLYADSMLGEAMALRPVVLMSSQILMVPALKERFGSKAAGYIRLSEKIFEKWDRRGAWRNTQGGGMISLVLPFGIDQKTGTWTDGYDKRNAPGNGYSHPDNKANFVASWLMGMFDATREPVYKERAEKWFRLMKSRLKLKDDGTYEIWNYWQPAGAWDYTSAGLPKHWVGVHPNAGYYDVDVQAIVAAYEHGLVFNKDDIDHLIATSLADRRYWTALVPYNESIQKHFEENHKPDSWAGLYETPWYLGLLTGKLSGR